ncbi:outer membrane receptor protein involved in Fe transport [Sphingomonas kyeonggiensis]|uniref:Outer membrane receptor protein involved in Fe transport n=1 Tax=Sphingomonas kyeonggiensis TaxID=1268553 RepID=A0A7W7NQR9_9SPHN|nr:TonB-dependent receptor [Sphingomonas kyeonggiensis]MBB4837032.1 outer membrane receptor protein involved in Fe transport [Sphingomonas kyeonggiensis]
MIRTLAAALATGTCIVALATPAAAQTREYNIPAGSLKSALDAYVRQSGRQIVYRADEVRSARSPGARGQLSAEAALANLLADSGFTTRADGNLVAIVKSSGNASVAANQAASNGEDDAQNGDGQEIVVTGSNIRGVVPAGSPLTTYTREEITRSGVATIGQFLKKLPENAATIDESTIFANTGDTGITGNNTRGTSINLHGQGAGSTLVLVNGHRLAPSGADGSSTDISLIPLAVVERVDVLADGASAVYGADAVAGVVNFRLRRNFEGAESSARYGFSRDGGGEEWSLSQLAGTVWTDGGILGSYEHYEQSPILTSQRDFIPAQPGKFQIGPQQNRDSLYLFAHQAVGPVALTLDGYYSKRKYRQDSFLLVQSEDVGSSEVYGGTFGAELSLGATWSTKASLEFARNDENRTTSSTGLTTVVSNRGEILSGNISLDGSLANLPGGDLKLAAGATVRSERFRNIDGDLKRTVLGFYGEAFIPLVGEDNTLPIVRRLEISLAGRYDKYEGAGSDFSPKLGIHWEPITGFELRSSYSEAFRAPPLGQLADDAQEYFVFPLPNAADPNGITNTIFPSAPGNPGLRPERSKSFTVGFDLKPVVLNGFRFSGTYFSIRYRDRIARPPVVGSLLDVYSQLATLGPFIDFSPSPAEVAAIYAGPFVNPFDIGQQDVEAIFDYRLQNVAATFTDGLDLSASYTHSSESHQISLFASATRLMNLDFRSAPGGPKSTLLGTVYNPPKWRARAGATWSSREFELGGNVNYTGPYRNELVSPSEPVSSYVTVDAQVAYTFGSDSGPLHGLKLGAVVENLFDRNPPSVRYPASTIVYNLGYDPVNASARGRFISFRITKSW